MSSTIIHLADRKRCHYRLDNPWQQPLGRIAGYLKPILIDPQSYVVAPRVRLVSDNLVGVRHFHTIVDDTLHLQALKTGRRTLLKLCSILPFQERISGAICSLIDRTNWSGSYYHWFIDALHRLIAVEDHARQTGELARVIVPARLSSWQLQSLEMMGITSDRMINFRGYRRGRGGLAIDRLIAYSGHRWQRLGDAPGDAVSPWAIQQLSERLNRTVPSSSASGLKRLYLSRRGVQSRQVVNEDALLALLEPYGFVAVQTEKFTLIEQIQLFRGATHIVAPHGASLTNLLHARGGYLLELFQDGHGVRPDFFQLATIRGLQYRHAVCPATGPEGHVKVDLDVVRDFLAWCL